MITIDVNGEKLEIHTPVIDEILDDNFSYPQYREKAIKEALEEKAQIETGIIQLPDAKELADLYFDQEPRPTIISEEDNYINIINTAYYFLIKEILEEYEKDVNTNKEVEDNYTEKLKKVASEYMVQINLKMREETIKNLLINLKQIINNRTIEEQKTMARVIGFLNGDTPIYDLYLSDMPIIKENGKTDINIEKIERRFRSAIPGKTPKETYEKMTLGEIYDTYIKKDQITR